MSNTKPKPGAALIKIQGVDFAYQTKDGNQPLALSNCNLTINCGEFIAIVGSNGSGKSTLAKHLNGLLKPLRGKVEVAGLDTGIDENLWSIRGIIGMVFQNPDNQLVAAIAEDDVAFGPENLAVSPTEIRSRVDYYLDKLKLTSVKDLPPHLLSGGQKQRLAIAGVLAMRPRCLVLDEPTAMLDPAGRADLLQILQQLNQQQDITIILITHNMEEAALADRLIVLNDGQIMLDGPPQVVFAQQHELSKYGLELPVVVQMASLLKAQGFNINELPISVDELVKTLCGQ
ncbi:energy-coupling factor transporter ATPase [Peptococcaceae bacterium 1198_IL3148]